ncbi:MAG: hypothetical protein HC848_03160 [Limnobacter sp.]|nr:hypothetical protein [Limnobacter sp.]
MRQPADFIQKGRFASALAACKVMEDASLEAMVQIDTLIQPVRHLLNQPRTRENELAEINRYDFTELPTTLTGPSNHTPDLRDRLHKPSTKHVIKKIKRARTMRPKIRPKLHHLAKSKFTE